jgi:GNAT superfamily N-acetyltransferase
VTERVPERRSATLELVRTLYPRAPHAVLCMPFCKLKDDLARCHFLASTNGHSVSAVVAYSREAIEFTWCRPACTEMLRNLIVQAQRRMRALAFLPVVESGRSEWYTSLGLTPRGRFFRAVLSKRAGRARELPRGLEIAPCDPSADLQAAADLLAACEPDPTQRPEPDELRAQAETDYFYGPGWFFLKDGATGRAIGLSLSGYCPEFDEGFVDWIQVLPEYRHRGLGTVLLCESIHRLQHAAFITVSGSLEPPHGASDLFERCGFKQIRTWRILAQGVLGVS